MAGEETTETLDTSTTDTSTDTSVESTESDGGGDDGTSVFGDEKAAKVAKEASTATDEDKETGKETTEEEKETESPQYKPDFKVKAFGKDFDMDENFRSLIKDAESEAKIKKLYSGYLGAEEWKNRHDQVNKTVQERYEPLVKSVQDVAAAYKQGDFDAMFQMMQIPEKKIYEWVAEKIRLSELPESERAVYADRQKARQEATSLQAANAQLAEQQMLYQTSQRSFELDQGLTKPEIKEAAQMYDSLYGENAFKQAVIQTGQFEFAMSKKDLSPQEAIQKTIDKMKPVFDRMKTSPQASTSTAQKQPAVIPNPQGRSGSPAKKTVRTMDDLKRLAAAME